VEDLQGGPVSAPWLQVIEGLVGERSMHEGHLAAKEGAVRSLSVEAGVVRGPVQADAEASLAVSIQVPAIDEAGWQRVIDAMACEAIWSARLLEGTLPPGADDLFGGCGTSLLPQQQEVQTHVDRGGRRDGWRVAALAWIAAERFWRDPLAILMVRGLKAEVLVERVGHRRALRTQGETTAHPPVMVDPALAAGPPLGECMDTWWRPHGHLSELEREPHAHHALLRRLGPSTLDGKFPLSGLLATIYDEAASEAARLLDAPLGDNDSIGSVEDAPETL